MSRKTNRAKVPTIEEINALYNEGNLKALQELNETIAKRSNQRLATLEKSGFDDTAAYNLATDFIKESEYGKNNRFSRSKKMDIDSLHEQLIKESNFLRWQTSTPAGEIKRREKIFESLTTQRIDEATGEIVNPVLDIPTDMDIDVFKKKFLKFLDEDSWGELKKHIYTKNILNEAGEAIAAGASVEELTEAVKAYMRNETEQDLLEIWDGWTSANNSKR